MTGKGGKTRVVRLSRGTWEELQALRTDETIGEDCVFPMSAVNAWKRVKRAARLAGISEVPVSPHLGFSAQSWREGPSWHSSSRSACCTRGN